MTEQAVPYPRLAALRDGHPEAAAQVARLLMAAPVGLAAANLGPDHGFAQTLRGYQVAGDWSVRAEGRNVRYAAMAALGLATLPIVTQQQVLTGGSLGELCLRTLRHTSAGEPGALALAVWAEAETGARASERSLAALLRIVTSPEPVTTVAVAWAVTAGIAARHLADTSALVERGCRRLLAHGGAHGIFPHVLAERQQLLRGHVGSFADQVYPLQALARAGAATGDASLVAAAGRTAALLCHHQGAEGQWWWHYDTRTGDVVERYPVYSVHQHAMAPMVLFDLLESGGADHTDAIARGVGWLLHHPEVAEDLVNPRLGVVWRKVGRRERAKLARVAATATTAIRPGFRVPGVDRLLPPSRIDHECRPYELGWLLYAWLAPSLEARAGTPEREEAAS